LTDAGLGDLAGDVQLVYPDAHKDSPAAA
jgi:hypothetical protein